MRLSKLILSIALFFTFSCQSTTPKEDKREVAQYNQENEEQQHERLFESLMAQESDAEKSRSFANYLDRQRSFYYVAQQLLFSFDEKLDVIYNKKMNGEELSYQDMNEFAKIRFQNLIAWEFSERNSHEMLDLYQSALEHAHTENSPHQKSSRWIVTNVKKWIDEGWKKGDKSAIINLASQLNDVNVTFETELKKLSPGQIFDNAAKKKAKFKIPSFKDYANPTSAMTAEAFQRSKWLVANRKKTHLDTFVEKEWSEYLVGRAEQSQQDFMTDFNNLRTPQNLDELYPSADGKGHVTGNRFPMGKWAMTFDDGPAPKHTQGMVDALAANNVHGTFFWQTQNVVRYPSIPQTKSALFSRALHSYTHANLPKQSASGLDKEINRAVTDFAKVVGEKPTMFRCPYGACGPMGGTIRQMIAKNNMLHIAWNVDTLDWQDKNAESIFQRSKKQIDSLGRGIVLFHDIHPQSVIATDKVIKYLKSKYKIEPLHKLIEESRGKPYYTP